MEKLYSVNLLIFISFMKTPQNEDFTHEQTLLFPSIPKRHESVPVG